MPSGVYNIYSASIVNQTNSTGHFCVKPLDSSLYTDIGDAEQGEEEGEEGCGKGEELAVPLEDLKVVGQACDDGLHAAHLVDTSRERDKRSGEHPQCSS